MTKITMPDGVGETISILEDEGKIVFLSVNPDYGHPNPLEDWDGVGMIYSFNRRHSNSITEAEYERIRDQFGPDRVPLGYFEHGNCDWHLMGNIPLGTAGDYAWDGVEFAGIWVPDEHQLGFLDGLRHVQKEDGWEWEDDPERERVEGKERKEALREYAKTACEVYTAWCNGSVYWYSLAIYDIRKEGDHVYDRLSDYRYSDVVVKDAVGGFFDYDHLTETIYRQVKHHLGEKYIPEEYK